MEGKGVDFFAVVKWQQREADLSLSSDELMNDWRDTSTILHSFTTLKGTILPVFHKLKNIVVYFNVEA